MKSSAHPLFAHLTESEINELIKLYYDGVKIKDLLKQFNLKCAPINLYKQLPPLLRYTDPCPNCGAAMLKPRSPRGISVNARNRQTHAWRCVKCNHIERDDCPCDYCQLPLLRLEYEGKTEKRYLPNQPFNPHEYEFEQVVSLLALALLTWKEYRDMFPTLADSAKTTVCFAPKTNYGEWLINKLLESEFLKKEQDENVFLMNDMIPSKQPSSILFWNVPKNYRKSFMEKLAEHIQNRNYPKHWITDAYNVAHSAAMAECLEFYSLCADERKFSVAPKESITAMLSDLLREYSIEQCEYIILESAKAASDYLVKHNNESSIVAQYMLEHCKFMATTWQSNNLEIPCLDKGFPHSMVSYLIFDIIAPCVDGFSTPLKDLTMTC
jgi:hypothetical protein